MHHRELREIRYFWTLFAYRGSVVDGFGLSYGH